MEYRETPKFIIKRNMQKSAQTGIYFDYLVTHPVMGQICFEVTGRNDYEFEFVDNAYQDVYKRQHRECVAVCCNNTTFGKNLFISSESSHRIPELNIIFWQTCYIS